MRRFFKLLFVTIFAAMLTGCMSGVSTTQLLYYPKGEFSAERTHGRIWLEVQVPFGDYTVRRKRTVVVTVDDQASGRSVSWEATVVSASPELTFLREDKAGFVLAINEYGNKFSSDEYNVQLLKNGPRRLFTLRVDFNGDTRPLTVTPAK